jgi:hypothetical protein
VCALLAFPARAADPFIVGNWYGEAQPHDPNVYWLAHFWPGGRFAAKFRTCHGKTGEDEDDTGTWSYRADTLEVTSTRVDGQATFQVERYHTLSYDGRKHVYRHEASGFVFTAVRVRADFELPSCNLSS